jgi:hypothetical protein
MPRPIMTVLGIEHLRGVHDATVTVPLKRGSTVEVVNTDIEMRHFLPRPADTTFFVLARGRYRVARGYNLEDMSAIRLAKLARRLRMVRGARLMIERGDVKWAVDLGTE